LKYPKPWVIDIKNRILFVISVILLSFFLASCSRISKDLDDERLNVIVSILPQKTFVEAVGGDLVNVKELIPIGASPSTYEPKPSDLIAIEKADVYFRIGYIQFEKSHLDKFVNLNSKMKVVDTSQGIILRYFEEEEEHSHEHNEDSLEAEDTHEHNEEKHSDMSADPHIWLSPMLVKKQIDVISQTLSEKDPVNAQNYYRNAKEFKEQLDSLHVEIKLELGKLKTNKLLVFHPAWGYFADEYGLKQIAIEQSGKEPTPKQLQQIITQAKEEDIKVIFIQSQFNKDIAESIASEVGAIVISIDPLSESYVDNLRNIAKTIKENLDK